MTYLLGARMRALLARIAAARPLLAFDFDGTLAPIVADRASARMRSRTARLLRQVCTHYPCAVITGRSRTDVVRRLGGTPIPHVVGDHGADLARGRDRAQRLIATVHARLTHALMGEPGIEIEAKPSTLAIHYRLAPRPLAARRTIDRALAPLGSGVRAVPGKFVVNLVPSRAPHKGDALRHVLRRAGAGMAVYIGDDYTDEDVFRLDLPEALITVRVGRSRISAAQYYLRDQAEIDVLLRLLVDDRGISPTARVERRSRDTRNG